MPVTPGNHPPRDPQPPAKLEVDLNLDQLQTSRPAVPTTTTPAYCSRGILRGGFFLDIAQSWPLPIPSPPPTPAASIDNPLPDNCPAPRFLVPVPDVPRMPSRVQSPETMGYPIPDGIPLVTVPMTRCPSLNSVPLLRLCWTKMDWVPPRVYRMAEGDNAPQTRLVYQQQRIRAKRDDARRRAWNHPTTDPPVAQPLG